MSSSNVGSQEWLEELIGRASMTMGQKSADDLATFFSAAYVAVTSDGPPTGATLDVMVNSFRSLLENFEREELEPGGSHNPYIDPFFKWEEEHPEEMAKYAGKHVALKIPEGIIGAANSYAELHELLKQKGTNMEEVLIDCVPQNIEAACPTFAGIPSDEP